MHPLMPIPLYPLPDPLPVTLPLFMAWVPPALSSGLSCDVTSSRKPSQPLALAAGEASGAGLLVDMNTPPLGWGALMAFLDPQWDSGELLVRANTGDGVGGMSLQIP